MSKIEKSIVASGGSTIINSKNKISENVRKIKIKYTIIGFILGILSSLMASFIYDLLTR